MIKYIRAEAGMIEDILKLCNFVFRKSEKPEHNDMQLQFPFLLSEANAHNLIVAVDGDRVVSHIGNSLIPMIIDDVEIPYGQIGAVCTHPDYRGQGLGTQLLFKSLENFKENNVNLITISGGRGLYRRNGAVDLGCVGDFEFAPECCECSADQIDFYEGGAIGKELIDLYNSECTRYKRTATEFQMLIDAMPVSSLRPIAITAVERKNGKPVAYVSGFHDSDNSFKTIEFAGDAEHISNLLCALANKLDLHHCRISVQNIDKRYKYFLKNANLVNMSHLPGATFMVINPKGLFDQLQPVLQKRGLHKIYAELPLDLFCAENDGVAIAKYLFDSFNIFYTGEEDLKALPLMLPNPKSYNYI